MELQLEELRVLPAYIFFVTFGGCRKCSDLDTSCADCKGPLKYQKEAFRQPYTSILVETSPIYLEIFDIDKAKPETIPYSTLFCAYTSLIHYFMLLFNPNIEKKVVSLSNRINARLFRNFHIWQRQLNFFKTEMDRIYMIDNATEGRRAVLQEMERIILVATAYMKFINKKKDDYDALNNRIEQINRIVRPPLRVFDFSSESNDKFNESRTVFLMNEAYKKQMDLCNQIGSKVTN